MPTSNPALSEKVFSREIEQARGHSREALDEPGGWAAPGGTRTARPAPPAPPSGTAWDATTSSFTGRPTAPHGAAPPPPPAPTYQPGDIPPAPDTVSAWPPPPSVLGHDTMRVGGVASATGVLGAVLLVAAFFGWHSVGTSVTVQNVLNGAGQTVAQKNVSLDIPGWIMGAVFVGFLLAIVTVFKPKIARITATLYAAAEGLFIGAISKVFEAYYPGIVLQAVELTGAVFVVMLGLFASGAIKVTNKLRIGVLVGLGAIVGIQILSWVLSLFGVHNPMIYSSGPVGIIFSLLCVGVGAFMLLIDFDFVRQAVAAKAPRYMEWYAAFGLMVTLVWLYLEILRLLAQLRN